MSLMNCTTATRLHIRPWTGGDDALAITGVLHRAYRPQVDAGLRPLAGRQTPETTAERIAHARCLLAEASSVHESGETIVRLAGVILLDERESALFPALFKEPGVAHFSMFAVEPELQGLGIGARLLDAVEERARADGRSTLACSMAGPDAALKDWYFRRGYTVHGTWQWPYTNYQSLILAKPLG